MPAEEHEAMSAQSAQRELVEQALASEAIAEAMQAYQAAAQFVPQPTFVVTPKPVLSADATT